MSRAICAIFITLILSGCATHAPTKNDTSASAGFTGIKDGTEQIDQSFFDTEKEPLSATQRAAVGNGRLGLKKVRDSASVAARAYDAAAKAAAPGQQQQNDRILTYLIIGAAVAGIGCFLCSGSQVKSGIGLIAAGAGFDVVLIAIRDITPAIRFGVWGIVVIGLAGGVYLMVMRILRTRELAREKQVTKDVVIATAPGQLEMLKGRVSDTTAAILEKTKGEVVSQNAAALA